MLSVLKGFVIAFAMYSRVPMPRIMWEEKNMKYAMCFFPLVGALTGALVYFWYILCVNFDVNIFIRTAVLTVIPVLVTGGLHMDGFLDTIDALSSNKPKEEKIRILSDPHAGAFAIIFCVVYFILYFGFAIELSPLTIVIFSISFVMTRAMSALSIVTFKMAKDNGLARTFSDMSSKIIVGITSIIYIIACIFFILWYNYIVGGIAVLAVLLVFLYYRYKSYKSFGGTTGDLCGYFLQLCELMILICLVGGEMICF